MKLSTRRIVRNLFLVFALGTLLLPAATFAQTPGKHPAYLHALSDLRMARAYLATGTDSYSIQAISQIDAAIGDIKKASIDDGKNINEHPPIDVQMARTDRFKKALELVNKAHDDVAHEEDDAAARSFQAGVIRHIDAAHNLLDQAIAAGLK
ncbi:MAG: hypothetical protein WCC87_21405 [Candidatus Korobacteraceae bacterium]